MTNELDDLKVSLKSGEYDGTHIMQAWLLVDKYKELQAAHEAQQIRIDELEMLLSEQLLIIKGFMLECEDMGTTDIITALSRKDTQIIALEARCKELENALAHMIEGNVPQYDIDTYYIPLLQSTTPTQSLDMKKEVK